MSSATTAKYVFGKTVGLGFDEAISRVTEALSKEGFGVLTEIDVAATLKKKLGLDMPPYRILGACNPQFAHKAIEFEPQIGALLPCNVVVREEKGKTHIDIMDPHSVLQLVERPEIEAIATEVRKRLERVLAAL
ncbi:MAG: DUF302 domain-containing protein [Betaproteobacteria bacterium]|nr:DUF302 domain-containing protein [Betaproteobacteria bacterium]MDH4323281.1 DUF302 domain-containing protein [Betaproteobacteria bacterium]